MEEIDDEEFFEIIKSKGSKLEPFKNEYLDLQKTLEILIATNVGKEREIDSQKAELRNLKDQLLHSKRNIEELISQQEVLKETIESISHKKESLANNEIQNREEMKSISSNFDELKEALAIGHDWTPDQIEQKVVLEKERDFIASKFENKTNQLNGIRSDMERSYNQIQKLESEIEDLDKNLDSIDEKRSGFKQESRKLVIQKEELEKKIFELRGQIVSVENEIYEKAKTIKSDEKALKDLDSSVIRSKMQMELYLTEYNKLYRSLQDNTNELEKQNVQNTKFEAEIEEKKVSIEELESNINKLNKELIQVNKLKEAALQKIVEAEEEKKVNEAKVENLNKQIASIRNGDVVQVLREIDNLDKQTSGLKQEVEILRKKNIGSEKTTKAILDLIQLNENGKVNLNIEIKILKEDVEHHKNKIRQFLAEKEKFEHDAEVANQQYFTSLEEMKLQELQIQELNKKISADQAKLKQKQSFYENVRADRNLYSKQLNEAQNEISSLKRKFRDMNHQIDQLKEEISAKDHTIVKEHFLHHSVDKERELLKNELTKIKKQIQSSEVIIENQRVEIMKLQRIVEEADQESQRQKNELSTVLSERNLLTAQLVKRNAELNQMYEKIKIQRSNLKIGERNYEKFLHEFMKWRSQLKELIESHNQVMEKLAGLEDTRTKVAQLEKEILREQNKSRALMDELETPMNIHRWRKLESSDPKRYEKITQIHSLQQQLVAMSDKVIQNDLLIQEKEKIYIELKNVIGRHPGPEVEEQILVYQQTLKDKSKQLKDMNEELQMYIEQVSKFKEEISDCDKEMIKLNKKWMKSKKNMDI